jgi:hypothetical protein
MRQLEDKKRYKNQTGKADTTFRGGRIVVTHFALIFFWLNIRSCGCSPLSKTAPWG